MGPSRRLDESAHEARLRVVGGCMRDPLFWFALLFAVVAGVRWLNSGVDIVYNAEREVWLMSDSFFPMLPGSVSGVGLLPFATSIALFVSFAGLRHALGRQARMSFMVVATVLSGIVALVSVLSISLGSESVKALSSCDYTRPDSIGTAFGLYLLGGVVAHFGCVELRWMRSELLVTVALAATAVAFLVFSPIVTVLVFAVAFFVLVVTSFLLTRKVLVGTGSFRCALAMLLSVVVAGLFVVFAPREFPIGEKVDAVQTLAVFPEGFASLRSTLSETAFRAWKAMPWTGTGLGAFPIDIRFFATAADWKSIHPGQVAVPNGWWQLLVERGVVGAISFAIAFGMLFWTYFRRAIRSFGTDGRRPLQVLGPVVSLSLVALTFVDCSLMRADVLLAVCGFLALSACDIPERKKAGDKELMEGGDVR